MSRVGTNPIQIPKGVTILSESGKIVVKGPQGQLELVVPKPFEVVIADNHLIISKPDSSASKNIHGLFRSLLNNAVLGVTKGWQKNLELVGVGYKASGGGNEMILNVGFTHPVKIPAPGGITFSIVDNTKITVTGNDKKLVGEMAARIRSVKPPEPYKGKGIRYLGEIVRKKAGKAVKAQGAGTA